MLLSYSFAGQAWKLPTDGPVETKPVFFDDKLAVASYDGNVEYVFAQTGSLAGKAATGEQISSLAIGNGLLVGASGSKIIILDKTGKILHTIDEAQVYGIGTGDYIYATTAGGLKAYDYQGNLVWNLPQNGSVLTSPLVLNTTVIFGSGTDLVAVDLKNRTEISRTAIGPVWKSKPASYSNFAYIGCTDGMLYAVNITGGTVLWSYQTGGWVMSDPLYSNGAVYFGSNDGNIYSVKASDGALIWKHKTAEAIQGSMDLMSLGGKDVLVTGSNDNRVYAFDLRSGNVTLSFSVGGWVHNPAPHDGRLYFGSYDGSIYSYIADRACSIDYPPSGEIVGYLPFNATGRVFSQYSGPKVSISVDDKDNTSSGWLTAYVSGNEWTLEVDPNNYQFGSLRLQCMVSDSAGQETKGFTYSVILRDENSHKAAMAAFAPSSVTEGKQFTVTAYDEDGQPLNDFSVIVSGKSFYGQNGTAKVTLAGVNQYSLVVKKPGYTDQTLAVSAGYDILMAAAVALAALGIIGAAFYLFVYKRKK